MENVMGLSVHLAGHFWRLQLSLAIQKMSVLAV